MPVRRTVHSFDLFDTLLARRCVAPHGVFLEVERALGAPGFAEARRAMEYRLAAGAAPFDLYDIYTQLVTAGTLTRRDADRLCAAEIECEFDNALPIMENLRLVAPGDLVVSDMYLPREILRRLLRHIGLWIPVELFVSNAGKHHGTIWPHLLQRWLVVRHLGDNAHADVATPTAHGIPCLHYVGAGLSGVEQALAQIGQTALARVLRALRLSNPYPAGTQEAELWVLATQLNLPLLVLFSAELRRQRDALGKSRLLLSARDCFFLAEIFASLYPAEPTAYVHVSREVLGQGGEALRRYLLDQGIEHALVCDISATGVSWRRFAEASGLPLALSTLVLIDNWALAQEPAERVLGDTRLSVRWFARSSEIKDFSPAIETLNTAPHGTCVAIGAAGALPVAELEVTGEFSPILLDVLQKANQAALAEIARQRQALRAELAVPPDPALPRRLLEAISQSPLLLALGEKLQWPKSFGPPTP